MRAREPSSLFKRSKLWSSDVADARRVLSLFARHQHCQFQGPVRNAHPAKLTLSYPGAGPIVESLATRTGGRVTGRASKYPGIKTRRMARLFFGWLLFESRVAERRQDLSSGAIGTIGPSGFRLAPAQDECTTIPFTSTILASLGYPTPTPPNSGTSGALKAQRSQAPCAVLSTTHCQHEPRAGGSDAKHSKPPAFGRYSTTLCCQCFCTHPDIPHQTGGSPDTPHQTVVSPMCETT